MTRVDASGRSETARAARQEPVQERWACVVGWASFEAWCAWAQGGGAARLERLPDGRVAAFDRIESLESFASCQEWALKGAGDPIYIDMGRVEVWCSQPTVLPLDPGAALEAWSLLALIAKGGPPGRSRFLEAEPEMAPLFRKLHEACEMSGQEEALEGGADALPGWGKAELRAISKHVLRGLKESKASFGIDE